MRNSRGGVRQTFPKDGLKKANETIQELKAIIRQNEKDNRLLREELENIMKPVRKRKHHIDRNKMPMDEWRVDFVKRFKKEVLGIE